MNAVRSMFRLIAAWIALLAAQMVVGMLVHVNAPSPPNQMPWLMVSNALIVLALGAAALRSDWRDWRLLRALFLIPAVIGLVNLLEGIVFLPNVGIDWRGTIFFEVLSLAVAALLWLVIFRGAPVPAGPLDPPIPQRSFGQKVGRFALCSACYVFLYFGAGMIIFPYVRDFYATQHIPGPGPDHRLAVLRARSGVHPGLSDVAADVSAIAPVRGTRGRTGVHPPEWSLGPDHAQPVFPRHGALGTLLRSHQLELCVWVCGGMGLGPRPAGSRIWLQRQPRALDF